MSDIHYTKLDSLVEYTEPGGLKERFVCNVKYEEQNIKSTEKGRLAKTLFGM